MTNLVIHPKLQNLLPPLSEQEYAGLEKDILENGCLSPIVTWNETIVDGHNRYKICQKHGLPFDTKQMEFASLDDARFWAWMHQENRRNLTPYQRTEIALQFKSMLSAKGKENKSLAGGDKKSEQAKSLVKNSPQAINGSRTRSELAKIADVSENTVSRVEFLDKHADEETKNNLRQGKTTINREYKRVKEKTAKPKTARTKKTSKESPVAEPQREPETSEPSPSKSKNVPCIEELDYVRTTTLKDIRQDKPDHLLRNLASHFRKGYIADLILDGMEFLHHKEGEAVTDSLLKELNKRYAKTKR